MKRVYLFYELFCLPFEVDSNIIPMDELREILPFLAKDARLDLKVATLQTVLGLTGSPQGIDVISSLPEMVDFFITKTHYYFQ